MLIGRLMTYSLVALTAGCLVSLQANAQMAPTTAKAALKDATCP